METVLDIMENTAVFQNAENEVSWYHRTLTQLFICSLHK